VLRSLRDKLLHRDLDARRSALRNESADFGPQSAVLQLRAQRLQDRLSKAQQQSARSKQLLSAARAGDEDAPSQLEALMESAAEETRALTAEADALSAESDRLSKAQQRIIDGLDAIKATETRRMARVGQTGLVIQLITVAIGLVLPGDAKAAHSIHVEYYAAVAGIAPLLLLAGLVELAFLRPVGAVWGVLSFAVPAVGAVAASLNVLATHKSTLATLFLTLWGLVATLVLLIAYVVAHATDPRAG
jgi:hypothetical protein